MEHSRLWISVLTAVIGLAILSVLLSPKAKTTEVLGAAGGAFDNLLATAVSPITGTSPVGTQVGASVQPSNYAGSGAGGFGQFTQTAATILPMVGQIGTML